MIDAAATKTHCRSGHLLSDDNLYTSRGRRECRKCRLNSNLRWKKGNRDRYLKSKRAYRDRCAEAGKGTRGVRRALDASERERLLKALRGGMTITDATDYRNGQRRYITTPIVSFSNLKFTRKTDPAFNNLILPFAAFSGPRIAASTTIVKTNSWLDAQALPLVNKAVSAHVPFFMRDDIKQELLVMLWSGEITPDQIAATAKRLLTKQYSSYDLSSKFGHRSLDAVMFDDSARTRYDIISEDQRLWA